MLLHVLAIAALAIAQGGSQPASERVIGGKEVSSSKYVVGIYKKREFKCAGAIIRNKFVLTAGYCIDCDKVVDYTIHYGSPIIGKGQIFYVDYCKQAVKDLSKLNDLAVLKVDGLPDVYDVIERPTKFIESDFRQTNFTLYGWGQYNNNVGMSNVLRTKDSKYIMRSVCAEMIGNVVVSDSEICTEAGACDGDDGGPLVYKDRLYGIILKPLRCNLPMMYTNVYSLRVFINNITNTTPKPEY